MGHKEYEKAIAYIRGLIAEGTLRVGSRLPAEREISEKLLISRNSTREAIRTLENMGAIESRRGSGNYLSGNMLKNVSGIIDMMLLMRQTTPAEICRFRRSMEKTVCGMIMENPRADSILKDIPPVLEAFPGAKGDEQLELDNRFHYLLIHASGNTFLILLMDAITEVYRRWIDTALQNAAHETRQRLSAAHAAIFESLLTKDRQACMDAIDEHYDMIEKEQMDYEI